MILGVWLFGLMITLYLGAHLTVRAVDFQSKRYGAVLSNAAMWGARELPFRKDAVLAVKRYLRYIRPELADDPSLKVTVNDEGDTVTVTVQPKLSFTFINMMKFLVSAVGEDSEEFVTLNITRRAHLKPRDVLIFVDNSNYLGPDPAEPEFLGDLQHNGSYSRWQYTSDRSTATLWGVSPHLKNLAQATCRGEKKCAGNPLKDLTFTQQCFNPVFSSIKEAAYIFYDYLISTHSNRVGVIAGPSADGGLFTIREFGHFKSLSQGAEAKIDFREHARSGLSDADCLYAAEDAYHGLDGLRRWMDDKWAEPRGQAELPLAGPHGRQFGYPSEARDQNENPMLGVYEEFDRNPLSTRVKPENRDFRGGKAKELLIPSLDNWLTAQRAIWARALNPSRSVVLPQVLHEAANQLFGGQPTRRSYPMNKTPALIYLLLGDFPRGTGQKSLFEAGKPTEVNKDIVKELRQSLMILDNQAKGRPLWIVFIVLRHDRLELNCQKDPINAQMSCHDHFNRFKKFEELLSSIEKGLDSTVLIPVHAPDPASLAYEGSGLLPIMGKEIVPQSRWEITP